MNRKIIQFILPTHCKIDLEQEKWEILLQGNFVG